MKPKDFRDLVLTPNTVLGVSGDDGPSEWSHEKHVQGILTGYIIVERHHSLSVGKGPGIIDWDTAALVSLYAPLQTVGFRHNPFSEEDYFGDQLLLLHRYPGFAWANVDPTVHVLGVKQDVRLGEGPLHLAEWRPKTVWLTSAAVMTVEDAPILSQYARVLHRSLELKELKAQLDKGVITEREYEMQKTNVVLRYS